MLMIKDIDVEPWAMRGKRELALAILMFLKLHYVSSAGPLRPMYFPEAVEVLAQDP